MTGWLMLSELGVINWRVQVVRALERFDSNAPSDSTSFLAGSCQASSRGSSPTANKRDSPSRNASMSPSISPARRSERPAR